eukprot:g3889.t1
MTLDTRVVAAGSAMPLIRSHPRPVRAALMDTEYSSGGSGAMKYVFMNLSKDKNHHPRFAGEKCPYDTCDGAPTRSWSALSASLSVDMCHQSPVTT